MTTQAGDNCHHQASQEEGSIDCQAALAQADLMTKQIIRVRGNLVTDAVIGVDEPGGGFIFTEIGENRCKEGTPKEQCQKAVHQSQPVPTHEPGTHLDDAYYSAAESPAARRKPFNMIVPLALIDVWDFRSDRFICHTALTCFYCLANARRRSFSLIRPSTMC